MRKIARQVFSEIIWLIISFSLTMLLLLALFGKNFLQGIIDIHLHDTVLEFDPIHLSVPLFFLITFLIYFLKEFRNSFRRSIANLIFITAGVSLIIGLTLLIQTVPQLLVDNWTLYPPLSSLGPTTMPEPEQAASTRPVIIFLTALQMLTLIMLLLGTFCWGKQNSNGSQAK